MIKKCVICDTEFEALRSDGIYCSGKCRRKPWNDRNAAYHKDYASKNREKLRKIKEKWNRSDKGVANRKEWYENHKDEIIRKLDSNPNRNYEAMMGKRAKRQLLKHFPKACFDCGTSSGLIDAHHINKIRSDNSLNNLKWLCRKCHAIEHIRLRAPIS